MSRSRQCRAAVPIVPCHHNSDDPHHAEMIGVAIRSGFELVDALRPRLQQAFFSVLSVILLLTAAVRLGWRHGHHWPAQPPCHRGVASAFSSSKFCVVKILSPSPPSGRTIRERLPLKHAVQQHLPNPLSMKIPEDDFKLVDAINVTAERDDLKFQRK